MHFSLCFDPGWRFWLHNGLQDNLKAVKLHYSMQEIPLNNCPALGFQDTFLYLNWAIMALFLKLKWKPRLWWLSSPCQLPEQREFVGKIFKTKCLRDLLSWRGAQSASVRQLQKNSRSNLQDFNSFPIILNFFLPQIFTHHPPKPPMTQSKDHHVLWLRVPRELLLAFTEESVLCSLLW